MKRYYATQWCVRTRGCHGSRGQDPRAFVHCAPGRSLVKPIGLDDLVERIEGMCELPECYDAYVRYMLACLGLIEDALPRLAREALAEARPHWAGKPSDLAQAKARCMERVFGNVGNLDAREDNGIRAVMCVLDPPPPACSSTSGSIGVTPTSRYSGAS